jgi:predicted enzyme related to lactoylglutathione lyase
LAAVFVPVSNLDRSIAWYSRLLDLPIGAVSHEGQIYDLPVGGSASIILDAHGADPIVPSPKPLLMFSASNLEDALARARSLAGDVTSPEDIGSVLVFYLSDPDGHRICVKVDKH